MAGKEKGGAENGMVKPGCRWLRGESEVVEVVAEQAEGEYCEGKEVAACIWRAENAGEPVRFVL